MKNIQYKFKLFITLGLLLSLTIIWVYFQYFFDLLGECNKQLTEQVASLEKNYVAEEFLLGCGATSDFATQINLKNQKTGNEQMILSLKGDHTQSCEVEWSSETALQVRCTDAIALVYQKRNDFESVNIIYEGVDK